MLLGFTLQLLGPRQRYIFWCYYMQILIMSKKVLTCYLVFMFFLSPSVRMLILLMVYTANGLNGIECYNFSAI